MKTVFDIRIQGTKQVVGTYFEREDAESWSRVMNDEIDEVFPGTERNNTYDVHPRILMEKSPVTKAERKARKAQAKKLMESHIRSGYYISGLWRHWYPEQCRDRMNCHRERLLRGDSIEERQYNLKCMLRWRQKMIRWVAEMVEKEKGNSLPLP